MPRRRVVRRRFLRLALPIAAYWLAIAGVTHAFLRSTAGERAETEPVRDDTEVAAGDMEAPEAAPPSNAAIGPADGVDATESDGAVAEADLAAPANVAVPAASPEPSPPPSPEPPLVLTTAPPAPPAVSPRPPQPDFTPRRPPVAPPAPPRVAARSTASSPSAPSLGDPWLALAPPPDEPATTHSEVAPPPSRRESVKEEARAFALPSCDAAAAASNETIDMQGARGAPDLTRDAFASVLENGAYLNRCEIPARVALDICAAVQNGKVVGITVTSTPRSPNVNACVRRAVASLHFPQSARLDVTRTRFEAAR